MWPVHCHEPALYNFSHIKGKNPTLHLYVLVWGVEILMTLLCDTLAIWTHNILSWQIMCLIVTELCNKDVHCEYVLFIYFNCTIKKLCTPVYV